QVRLALAIAHARHLRAALLRTADSAGNVDQIARARRVGDVDERPAVVLGHAGEGILRLAAVMPDVGDEAAALLVDRGLIRRAALQVVVADQLHVAGPRPLGPRG